MYHLQIEVMKRELIDINIGFVYIQDIVYTNITVQF